MSKLNEEVAGKLTESSEMMKFYRVLATIHSNAVQRVLSRGGNAKDIISRAKDETEHLMKAESLNHKCPPGTIWDEVIGHCVKI